MTGRDKQTGIDEISGLQTVSNGDGGAALPPSRPATKPQPSPPPFTEGRPPLLDDVAAPVPATAGITVRHDYYPAPVHFRLELRRAPKIYKELTLAMGQMVADVRLGRSLQVAPVRRPLKNMIASVIRHPDALLWMTKVHVKDNYLTGHAVRCAVLSAVLARYLGIVAERMERLALGCLLSQIGKARLPKKLLEKRGDLNPEELERVRGYVQLGVELLRKCDGVFEDVIDIVESHQERFDGSGYPAGRWGDEIPILARIAGLVNCYDAMTSVRPHTDQVLSNAENLDFLYEQRDRLFQARLVEEFIQMLGIYPTGTFVEINTGAVALVLAQNPNNRTQPLILLVLDRDKSHFKKYRKVDIREYNAQHERPLTIRRAVSASEFGIDPLKVMEKQASGRFSLARLFGR